LYIITNNTTPTIISALPITVPKVTANKFGVPVSDGVGAGAIIV
jgi:hypothetical protein